VHIVRSRRRALREAGFCLGLFALSVPIVEAHAQATPEDRAAAEVLFNEAIALVDQGQVADGCRKFESSQKLDPQLGTLLYLATCHEQEGRTATAYAEFTEARNQAQRAEKAERMQQAVSGIERTGAKLSRLTITSEESPPGLVVKVNGRELKLLGEALPYDAGKLEVEASAPGRQTYTSSLELAVGPVSESLVIPPLAPLADSPSSTGASGLPLPWIIGGAGVGLTAVGLVFGGVAIAESSAADEHCRGALCTQEGLDGHAAADGWAWGSNIAVGLGLVGIGVGTYLLLTDDGTPPPVQAGAVVLPDGSFAAGIGGVW
jgi:hypothetical protein